MVGPVPSGNAFTPDNIDVNPILNANQPPAPLPERAAAGVAASFVPQGIESLKSTFQKYSDKMYGISGPDMSPEDIKDSFGIDAKQPMNVHDAQFLFQRQQAQEKEQLAFNNGNPIANFAARLVDPGNIALALIPVAGEANLARLAGAAGIEVAGSAAARAGVRAVAGGATFAGGQIPISLANYGLDKQANIDHSIADSLREVLFAGVMGAAFHPLFGAIGDAWKGEAPVWARAKYSERSDAAQTGLAQMMNERPIDVPKFTPLAEGTQYHGTSAPINSLSDSYAVQGDNRNIYGDGFYTTDSLERAQGYSKKGKGNEPTIYSVAGKEGKEAKLYDLESPMTPEVRAIAEKVFGDYMPGEDIDGKPIKTLRDVYDEFRENSSNERLTRDDVQGYFFEMRNQLEKQGYEGLQHIGGVFTGKPAHNVKIFWNPERDLAIGRLPENVNPEEFARTQENLAREGTSFGSSQAELKETKEAAEAAPSKPLEPTKELADLQQKADDAETQLKAAYGVTEGAVKEPGLLGKAVQKVKEAVTGKSEENLPPELQEKLKEANGHKEYADILAKSYDALKNCMMG